jgi:hypothetical protein
MPSDMLLIVRKLLGPRAWLLFRDDRQATEGENSERTVVRDEFEIRWLTHLALERDATPEVPFLFYGLEKFPNI